MYRKAEVLSRIQLRQSTIKDWLNCQLLFRFRHIEGLKPSYRGIAAIHGSALHLAIHRLHQSGFYQNLAHVYERALSEVMELESDIPVRWKKGESVDLEQMKEHAHELLSGYIAYAENELAEILYSEVQFRVRIGGHELTGTIDQVRMNSNGDIDLVDLKSGMQRPHAKSLPRDWQLSLYAYALKFGEVLVGGQWKRPRMSVDRTLIYFLRAHERYKRNSKYGKKGAEKGQPFIACEKPVWDHTQFRHDLLNLLKMMTKDWPFPNPSACGYCSFHGPCESRGLFYASKKLDKLKQTLDEISIMQTVEEGS